ncbi:LysM peptidoglycan-binding domain-containing protein [Microbacterium sp. 179-B 1A2 NHS]|uniref:LysM peptidoglycan-binding domain-containing protein n=1 Tax=Microbacterium sp. 179-B 1A2 NHS TaxID=3142383 RepID=UPI0039A2BE98
MRTTTRIAAIAAALTLALSALAGCSVSDTSEAGSQTPATEKSRGEKIADAYEKAKATPPEQKADDATAYYIENGRPTDGVLHPKCERVAYSQVGTTDGVWEVQEYGKAVDTGADGGAMGDVEVNGDGDPIAYTVASGDNMRGIADRFCYDSVALSMMNEGVYETIQPGQRLDLTPDEDRMIAWAKETDEPVEPVSETRAEAEAACAESPEGQDRGPLEHATGDVIERTATGYAISYKLAAGDTFDAVAGRFCVSRSTVNKLNDNQRSIQAGEVIRLR